MAMETQTLPNKYIDKADLVQLLKREFGANFEVDVLYLYYQIYSNIDLHMSGSRRILCTHNPKEVNPSKD
jgi:hypothetical protein